MSAAVDRMWSIRDAMLSWLYQEDAKLGQPTAVNAAEIQKAAGWQAEPITDDELDRDTKYLKDKGFMDGKGTWGGPLLRPTITSLGSDYAARGVSVRPGPERAAITTGVTNNFNITNNAPSNMAFNSSNFSQTLNVGEKREQIEAVAGALRDYAEQTPEHAERAEELADELVEAGSDPVGNAGKLQTLLTAVVGLGALANSEAGQGLMQLAAPVIQAITS